MVKYLVLGINIFLSSEFDSQKVPYSFCLVLAKLRLIFKLVLLNDLLNSY